MLFSCLSLTLPAAFMAAGFFRSELTFIKSKQKGQASVELIIVWPVVVFIIFGLVQVLLIWWAQQTLTIANQYAVRAGSLNHGRSSVMTRTLVAGMAGLKPQLDSTNMTVAAGKAIVAQRLHFSRGGKLTTVSPSEADFNQYANWRWDSEQKADVLEIAVDHYEARATQEQANDAWHQARVLVIETYWCLPLDIPMVGQFLADVQQRWSGSGAARYCASRSALFGKPLWGLADTAQHPMLSGYRKE